MNTVTLATPFSRGNVFGHIDVHGGFIAADQKVQLIAQGVPRRTLEDIDELRGRLLGGMKKVPEEDLLPLFYIRQLLQNDFAEGKKEFKLLLIALGAQDDPATRRTREEMRGVLRVGFDILDFQKLSPEEFRSLLKNLLTSFTYFPELREGQRALAYLAAQNELIDAKTKSTEAKLSLFINATYYYAKTFSIDPQNDQPLQEISKIFMQIIEEMVAPNFEANLNDALCQGDWDYFGQSIDRIPDLEKFQNSERDYQIIKNLYKRARNVILEFEEKGKQIPDLHRKLAMKIVQRSSIPYEPKDPTSPIRKYRETLREFREFFREKIKEIQPETARLIQTEIQKRFLSFLQILLDDAFLILGPPPCKYDLRAYGSIAKEEFCPYSDLEWMILIEKEEGRSYFKTLAQLLSLQIISIGETAPTDFPIFSATGPKHPSGFHVDSGGDPAQDNRLIGTPDVLARLQVSSPGLDRSELPTDAVYSFRNTISLRATDSGLFTKYGEKISEILDADGLRKKRAVDFLKFRLAEFKKLFAENWRKALILNLKKQFLELLYHPLSDLALYFGCQNLNTLDLIDELPCFMGENRSLLKEAVFFLYKCRLKLHFHYGEQKEEVSQFSKELKGYLPLEMEEKFLLEAAYLLIFCPFYAYLENLFSQENFVIEEIPLLDLVFEKACKEPETLDAETIISHLAKFFTRKKSSNAYYYKQLSEKNLGYLREVYCDALQEEYSFNLGNDFLKDLILSLGKIPDSSGNRHVLKRKRATFFQKLSEITSDKETPGSPVQISSPFFKKRYLLPEVVSAILDEKGHIKKQMQNTNSRVSSYEKEDIAFHFKEKPTDYKQESPFHPGREHAAAELMFRLFGRGTSISELFEIEVLGQNPQKYLVLISETIPGESPSLENPPLLDPIQLSELFLSLPLLLPGDMRPANLITTPDGELISVDNDVSWVKPYTKDGCNLYTILPFLYPEHVLHPDAIEAFLDLKPVPLLTDWLTKLITYNEQMLSVFQTYEEIPESKAWFSYIYYTSTCCFEKGTGAQLFLQFHQLQEFLRNHREREIRGVEILQTIISVDQDFIAPVGDRIYQEYKKVEDRQDVAIADKAKEVTQRRAIESTSMTKSMASFYRKIPQNKEELCNCAPKYVLEEIEKLAILKINEVNGLSLRIGEFSSLHLQRKDIFNEIDPATQRFLFKVLLLHKFEQLNLSSSCLEDMELKDLLEKTGIHLKVLDLRDCSNLTERSVGFINQYCPLLEELYLSRCGKIKTFRGGWFQTSIVFPNLKILHLTNCQNLRSFKIDAPKLIVLKIEGIPFHQDLALSLNNVGKPLFILGRFAESLKYQQQALEMGKQCFKEPHENLAVFLSNIGLNFLNLASYTEALDSFRQVLEMRRQLFKAPHQSIAEALNDIGTSLNCLGRYSEALGYGQQALEMYRQLFKAPHLDIAKPLCNIGIALDGLGKYVEALDFFQRSLEMSRQLVKAPHQDLAAVLNGVGVACNHLGKYVKALDYHLQALQMREQFFQGQNIGSMIYLSNIGVALNGLGKHADAFEYFLKALKMANQLIDRPHRFTAAILCRVGVSLNGLGRYAEALEYGQRALDMRRDLFGEKHFDITESLDEVGKTLANLGRHQEAFESHEQALQMGLALSPQNDAYVARSLYFLGLEEHCLGFKKKALDYFEQALRLKREVFKKSNRDIAKCLTSIAETLKSLGRVDEALTHYKEASEIMQALEDKEASYWSKRKKPAPFSTMFEFIGHPYQSFLSQTASLKNRGFQSISKSNEKEYEQFVFPRQKEETLARGSYFFVQKDHIFPTGEDTDMVPLHNSAQSSDVHPVVKINVSINEPTVFYRGITSIDRLGENVPKSSQEFEDEFHLEQDLEINEQMKKTDSEYPTTWYRVKDFPEENPFRVKIENGQLVWQAFGSVKSTTIKDIAEVYQRKYPGRALVVNTGVFGNEVGQISHEDGCENFVREDTATFRDNDNVKIHVVSSGRPPYTHEDGGTQRTDILDAWCFSAKRDKTKEI